jgi:predicted TIM-barrel fold metal-dependent hydrolase
MPRYMVISADCHAGLPAPMYRPYLEEKYRGDFDAYIEKTAPGRGQGMRRLFTREAIDDHAKEAKEAGGIEGFWQHSTRMKELEAEGIVAEVIFPDGTDDNEAPFRKDPKASPELLAAGARAYNRWVAELCAEAPQRRIGLAVIGVEDVEAAVAEIRWAKQAGLRGVMIPIKTKGLPNYYDERYEPIWAACEENELTLAIHGGGGSPDYGSGPAAILSYASEVMFFSRRPVTHLIWGGVFERHPELHFSLTEARAGWVPEHFEYLDEIWKSKWMGFARDLIPLPPSEYWKRQCFVGASSMTPKEGRDREQIGLENIMWGADFPHVEGTWPHSRKWLSRSLLEVPEAERRMILGENAARAYRVDAATLAADVERVGLCDDDFSREHAKGWGKLVFGDA